MENGHGRRHSAFAIRRSLFRIHSQWLPRQSRTRLSMSENRSPSIVFAGGGTLGHLFPGLALAERLANDAPHLRIAVAGGGRELEQHHVRSAGFEYWPLACRPFPRSWRGVLRFLAANWAGYRAALRLVDAERVVCVVGLGGYASVPMARAAISRRVPLVLLEQNVVPGRATRWLARRATVVCTAFAGSRPFLRPDCPVRLTGNPVRSDFLRYAVRSRYARNGAPRHVSSLWTKSLPKPSRAARRLVVLGGSGGARALNQSVPPALYQARAYLSNWTVVHQSGASDLEATASLYRAAGIRARVVPFITNLSAVLAGSDLAISRAGGTTLAELAVLGIPAILIPYPHAADDHQRRNAEVFAEAGAGVVIDQREAGGNLDRRLAGWLALVAGDDGRREAMAQSMRGLSLPDASWDIAKMIRDLAGVPAPHFFPGLPSSVDTLGAGRVSSPV
jgi:UDP-N-acetylglucosamine--N-acetylmuramyl-(pentapeptide) pyrophosphoryl-undecaprenol N-acetylglucosamine transferase